MDICFSLVLTSAVLLRVAGPLTLSWQHSVEHFRLEEDYRASAAGLVLTEVRTQGLGAGVDVPAHARWEAGWWRFTPASAVLPQVVLANSAFVPGYRVCWDGGCANSTDLVKGANDSALVMKVCEVGTP